MDRATRAKRKESEKIAQQTAEFLARGGKIRHAAPGEGKESESWQQAQKRAKSARKSGRSRERLSEIFAG